ncbi:uncharacterized protein [Acropora muricata]|uniref:uncharacterized protein isoform X3 n=1 Tax=Acropora muricata TaxID=159855 RepID=UPI0034E60387
MECLVNAPLNTQTVAAAVRFILSVIAFPTVIGRLASFVHEDRLAFNCYPKPNEVVKQGCYSRYTDDVSALMTPYTFTCITGGILLGFWILMILYSVKRLPEIRKGPELRKSSHNFWRVFLLHVFIEAVFLSVMMGLFCGSQTISLPEVYNCPQRNSSIQISPYQRENFTCIDWYYKQKSVLNIVIIAVMAVIVCLCIAIFGHAWFKRHVFTSELFLWMEAHEVESRRGSSLREIEMEESRTGTSLREFEMEESRTGISLRKLEVEETVPFWRYERSTGLPFKYKKESQKKTRQRLREMEENQVKTKQRLREVEESQVKTKQRLKETEESQEKTMQRLREMEEMLKLLQPFEGSTKQSLKDEKENQERTGKKLWEVEDSGKASGLVAFASRQKNTNYARLCGLLVKIGRTVLRDTFDSIYPPASLHDVLSNPPVLPILKSLKEKGLLDSTQWEMLFPDDPSTLSSGNFGVTLLMVLLKHICGLSPPADTGSWDKLPPDNDTSMEANIVRIDSYKNDVHVLAAKASIDDPTFNTLWENISSATLALGSKIEKSSIDESVISRLKTESTDPAAEAHYQQLLNDWKKDDDRIKETLKEHEEPDASS